MRLINTKTLQPTDIQDPQSIRYTILSHCWTDSEEAKFRGITDPANLRQTTRFAKIRTCQLGRYHITEFLFPSNPKKLTDALNLFPTASQPAPS